MTTREEAIKSIVELIDQGSIKFKYGLLWYLIYRGIGNGSDYHYQDLLKLNESEIHDILKPHIELWQFYCSPHSNIEVLKQFLARHMFHSYHFKAIGPRFQEDFTDEEKHDKILMESRMKFDSVDFLSDVLYYLLTHDNYSQCKIMSIVYHAANRVIRNYQAAELIPDSKDLNCMEYIRSYRMMKDLEGKCEW